MEQTKMNAACRESKNGAPPFDETQKADIKSMTMAELEIFVTEELGEKIGLALREQQEVCSVQDIVIARMIAMELVEGLTEEERRILAIEYFSDTTGEVSNAFKCRRSRLRRKIEESLGIFRKKRR